MSNWYEGAGGGMRKIQIVAEEYSSQAALLSLDRFEFLDGSALIANFQRTCVELFLESKRNTAIRLVSPCVLQVVFEDEITHQVLCSKGIFYFCGFQIGEYYIQKGCTFIACSWKDKVDSLYRITKECMEAAVLLGTASTHRTSNLSGVRHSEEIIASSFSLGAFQSLPLWDTVDSALLTVVAQLRS